VPGWGNKIVTTVVRFAPKAVLLPPTARALAGGRGAKPPKDA
jgi:hypothetical protein